MTIGSMKYPKKLLQERRKFQTALKIIPDNPPPMRSLLTTIGINPQVCKTRSLEWNLSLTAGWLNFCHSSFPAAEVDRQFRLHFHLGKQSSLVPGLPKREKEKIFNLVDEHALYLIKLFNISMVLCSGVK